MDSSARKGDYQLTVVQENLGKDIVRVVTVKDKVGKVLLIPPPLQVKQR